MRSIKAQLIFEVLGVKEADLARDREQLRTVVEVSLQERRGQHALDRVGCFLNGRLREIRVFRELVHVDHVRDRSKLVQCTNDSAAFLPAFNRHEEDDGGANQENVVDGGFADLNEVAELQGTLGVRVNVQSDESESGDEEENQCPDRESEQVAGPGDPLNGCLSFPGDFAEGFGHAVQSGIGESVVDPKAEAFRGFKYLGLIEAALVAAPEPAANGDLCHIDVIL